MQDSMQTLQLSEEKGKLKVRAKTREVEAMVLTVFLCFSAESMQFILVHWKNHTLHEADGPHGYELDDTNIY